MNRIVRHATCVAAILALADAVGCKSPTKPQPQLVFLVQPTSTTAGAVITPPVQVALESASGTTSSLDSVVSIRLGATRQGAVLSGTLTVPAVQGIASFPDLRMDGAVGEGFELTASATGSTSATSQPFSVTFTPAIAFGRAAPFGGPFNVYGMTADGASQVALTSDGVSYFGGWSPDGKHLLIQSEATGHSNIYALRADGIGLVNLTRDAGNNGVGRWSPDGSRIAFVSDRDGAGRFSELYVMNADGSGQVRLTADSALIDGVMALSPDGTTILFSSNRSGTFQLYLAKADGSGHVALTSGAVSHEFPAWSPRGDWIAYVAGGALILAHPDGTGAVEVRGDTLARTSGCCVVFSPDGTRIAFFWQKLLYVMDIGSMRIDSVSPARFGWDYSPSGWSPDGTRILFTVSSFDGLTAVGIMNADGTNVSFLGPGGNAQFRP